MAAKTIGRIKELAAEKAEKRSSIKQSFHLMACFVAKVLSPHLAKRAFDFLRQAIKVQCYTAFCLRFRKIFSRSEKAALLGRGDLAGKQCVEIV